MVLSSLRATPSPSFPLDTSIMASPRCMSCGIIGRSSVLITSSAVVRSRFPSSPPGWNCAKSRGLKSLTLIKATAKASPMASAAVVELVGARLSGHASCSTYTLTCTVEYFASSESGFLLIPMIGTCMWSKIGMNLSNSSVWPELLKASTTSSDVMAPRSP